MNKLFDIAVRAASIHDRENGVWVACVTPAEALQLINVGAMNISKPDVKAMMKAGTSRKIWFYFTVKTNSNLAKHLCVEKRHG